MAKEIVGNGDFVFFGSHAVDHYLQCKSWPQEGQKINAKPLDRVYGGMIPNAVAIFAGYGIAPLLLGPLEDNVDAAPILAEMAEAGVDTSGIRLSSAFKNSYAYNFLSDANPNEKTLVIVDPGYAFEMTPQERGAFAKAKFIYSTIAHLSRIHEIESILSEARAGGAKLFIDVEAESFRSASSDWWAFKSADFLSFNKESFAKFSGDTPRDTMITKVLRETQGEVIMTLGKGGCEVFSPMGKTTVPGIAVKAIDPLGAGDTFNSTYLFGRATGWPIARAARFANAAAARSTLMMGPRSGRTTIQVVDDFLENSIEPDAAAVLAD